MPLTIPDEALKAAGLTEREAQVEWACYLFEKGRLHLWPTARMAGLTRGEFERELISRKIPIHRITRAELERDLRSLREFETKSCRQS